MALVQPEIVLQLSRTRPSDVPVWENWTHRLRRWSFRRGRPDRFSQFQAATADVAVDNSEGDFTPVNIRPMHRLRLSIDVDSETEPFTTGGSYVGGPDPQAGGIQQFKLFHGFLERLPQVWPVRGKDAEVPFGAVDGSKPLNRFEFIWAVQYSGGVGSEVFLCGLPGSANATPANGPPFIPDDRSDVRIARVLDCIGWPAELRDLDEGNVTILGSNDAQGGSANIPVTGGKALAHIQAVAASEGGEVFIDREGRVAFRANDYEGPYDPDDIWSVALGDRVYRHIAVDHDEEQVANIVTVTTTRSDVASEAIAEDATSQVDYWPRDQGFSILPATEGGALVTSARAAEMLALRKDPPITVVDFQPLDRGVDASDLLFIFGRELLDRIRIQETPVHGNMLDLESRIEQIAMSQAKRTGDLHVSWNLSATEITTPPVLGGLVLWLDAARIEGLDDGDAVATWPDESGNGSDAAQGTAGNRPAYIRPAYGRPLVRFDGTNDYMETPAYTPDLANSTILVVGKVSDLSASRFLIDGLISSKRNYLLASVGTSKWEIGSGGSNIGGAATDTERHVHAATFQSAGNDSLYTDGVLGVTGASGGNSMDGATIGARHDGASPLFGDLQAVLVYDRVLSAAELAETQAYLRSYYGLP